MNSEKLVRRALRGIVFWKLVGDIVAFPRRLFECLAAVFGEFENAVFMFELEAARRYNLLTGVDAGKAIGEPHRHMGVTEPDALLDPDE